jgi:hypothetical protein
LKSTIELVRRYPTAKLAEWEIQFLPNCGWKSVERGRHFYLHSRVEQAKAARVLTFLRAEYRSLKFEIVESTP